MEANQLGEKASTMVEMGEKLMLPLCWPGPGNRWLLFAEKAFKVASGLGANGKFTSEPLIELRFVDARVLRSINLAV